jgi:hypothetical protein
MRASENSLQCGVSATSASNLKWTACNGPLAGDGAVHYGSKTSFNPVGIYYRNELNGRDE